DRLGRDRETGGQREDDRRVAEREEEADAQRALAVLEELAGRVVDRCDVVGVEGVAQTERVGERAQPGERGVVPRVVEEQPPADQVQEEDGAPEAGEAERLSARHHVRPAGHPRPPSKPGRAYRKSLAVSLTSLCRERFAATAAPVLS